MVACTVDIKTLQDDYLGLGLSTIQIAKKHGLSNGKVWTLLKTNGVKLRTRTEALQKYVRYRECIICGKVFRVKEKWNGHGNRNRKTCSPQCLSKLRSQAVSESWSPERKKHMSRVLTGRDISEWDIPRKEKRPNWKGGITSAAYNRIAFEEYKMEKKCEHCGTTKRVGIHHKDRNRANNNRENLMVLCRGCHATLHNKAKEVGVNCPNGYNTKNPQCGKFKDKTIRPGEPWKCEA